MLPWWGAAQAKGGILEHKLFSLVIFGQKHPRLAVVEPKLPTGNFPSSLPTYGSWTQHSPLKFIFQSLSSSPTCRVYSKENSNTITQMKHLCYEKHMVSVSNSQPHFTGIVEPNGIPFQVLKLQVKWKGSHRTVFCLALSFIQSGVLWESFPLFWLTHD